MKKITRILCYAVAVFMMMLSGVGEAKTKDRYISADVSTNEGRKEVADYLSGLLERKEIGEPITFDLTGLAVPDRNSYPSNFIDISHKSDGLTTYDGIHVENYCKNYYLKNGNLIFTAEFISYSFHQGIQYSFRSICGANSKKEKVLNMPR